MKQYLIGVNKRSMDIILNLFNIGATLMFYHHPIVRSLNEKYNFYEGEWLLLTDVTNDDSMIDEVRKLLDTYDDLKYRIIFYQELKHKI